MIPLTASRLPSARWWFLFFLGSGFAGLVYEVVWLRLAMAAFGVTTPLVSIVLSVFMAGLALGSWLGGRLARRLEQAPRRALACYAATELVIAACALVVPWALTTGRRVLSASETAAAWDSGTYYLASAAWVAATLLPACAAMGATFPLAMAAIRAENMGGRDGPPNPPNARTFSFLYLANVLGAACGTLASAFVLIELLGFRMTLATGVAVQSVVALLAFARSRTLPSGAAGVSPRAPASAALARPSRIVLVCLFITGLVSMAMELVWIRQFAPYLGNVVYAFAAVLATYLLATFAGSNICRTALGRAAGTRWAGITWLVAGLAGLLPLAAADPRLALVAPLRLALGIAPVCILCGLLTPWLVDRWSGGDPDRAGAAYAVNVLGSIAGPLVAGFALLPQAGESRVIAALALPLFLVGALGLLRPTWLGGDGRPSRRQLAVGLPVLALVAITLVTATRSYETRFATRQVLRDHTASVVAIGEGMKKILLVNGTSMTVLSPITKVMAHLPLAFLDRPPKDALVVCFGMGTTFRSLLTWDIEATAVELVPSVPELFAYYHADAPDVVRSPNGRIVIDDGRRLLERSPRRYDVITVDPPHPPEAAGSSLLHSREFYAIARARLRTGGILQQWIPATDSATIASVARAFAESFPHVRAFPVVVRQPSVDVVGVHFLGSDRPLVGAPATVLASRLPMRAVRDALEWVWANSVPDLFEALLADERPIADLVALAPWAPAVEDDRPYNEYFLLRRWGLH